MPDGEEKTFFLSISWRNYLRTVYPCDNMIPVTLPMSMSYSVIVVQVMVIQIKSCLGTSELTYTPNVAKM